MNPVGFRFDITQANKTSQKTYYFPKVLEINFQKQKTKNKKR